MPRTQRPENVMLGTGCSGREPWSVGTVGMGDGGADSHPGEGKRIPYGTGREGGLTGDGHSNLNDGGVGSQEGAAGTQALGRGTPPGECPHPGWVGTVTPIPATPWCP